MRMESTTRSPKFDAMLLSCVKQGASKNNAQEDNRRKPQGSSEHRVRSRCRIARAVLGKRIKPR